MADLPKAVWERTFTLLGIELKCCVLDNGMRIIEADSFHQFLDALLDPNNTTQLDQEELENFKAWYRKGMT